MRDCSFTRCLLLRKATFILPYLLGAVLQSSAQEAAYHQQATLRPPEIANPRTEDNSSKSETVEPTAVVQKPTAHKPDFNRGLYAKHKLEFSIEGGCLPVNVPFMFDFAVGDNYTMEDVHYTMVPIITSLDWQISKLSGPWILRGTWDATMGATFSAVARGPEARYFGYDLGVRRNFVYRNSKVIPYLDGKVGTGHIDARAPFGVWGAQGQDLVFTINIEGGLRYQINRRFAFSAGLAYMHVSNMYMSLPRYPNNGINVAGGMIGLHMIVKNRHASTQ